jgi:hypothetical protein
MKRSWFVLGAVALTLASILPDDAFAQRRGFVGVRGVGVRGAFVRPGIGWRPGIGVARWGGVGMARRLGMASRLGMGLACRDRNRSRLCGLLGKLVSRLEWVALGQRLLSAIRLVWLLVSRRASDSKSTDHGLIGGRPSICAAFAATSEGVR